MTNNDLKQELDLIHFALANLLELCSKDGIEALHLDGFVKLTVDRFADLHSNLISTLNTYEILDTMHSEGKEAALALADSFHSCESEEVAA